MNSLIVIFGLTALCAVNGQFMAMRTGGMFNPFNNPNHPANMGLANGIGIRNQFAWPAAAVIRNPWIPSQIANSPAVNIQRPEGAQGIAVRPLDVENKFLPDIAKKREAINQHVAKMIEKQLSGVPSWRPEFVNEKIMEKYDKIKEMKEMHRDAALKRMEMVEKRRQALKELLESGDDLEFGSVMKKMGKAYGKEMAEKNIEFQKKMIEKFEKPFLRPAIDIATKGMEKGLKIRTQIFQDFKERAGTLLKGKEFYIITRVANFTGDVLNLTVHIDSVKEAVKNLTEARIQRQLEIRDAMISELRDLRLNSTSDFVKARIDKQLEHMEKGMSLMKPHELSEWIAKIVKEDQELVVKHIETQKQLALQQIELQKAIAQQQIELQRTMALQNIEFGQKMAVDGINRGADIRNKALEETKKALTGEEILVVGPQEVDEALDQILDVAGEQVEQAAQVQPVIPQVQPVVPEVQPVVPEVQQLQQPQQDVPFFVKPPMRGPFWG